MEWKIINGFNDPLYWSRSDCVRSFEREFHCEFLSSSRIGKTCIEQRCIETWNEKVNREWQRSCVTSSRWAKRARNQRFKVYYQSAFYNELVKLKSMLHRCRCDIMTYISHGWSIISLVDHVSIIINANSARRKFTLLICFVYFELCILRTSNFVIRIKSLDRLIQRFNVSNNFLKDEQFQFDSVSTNNGYSSCSVLRTMTHHHPRLTTTLALLTSHTHARIHLHPLQEKRQSRAFGRFETVSRKRESIETTTSQLMYKSNI